ncbi:hypothetical protein JYB55_05620 [Mycolicibacterium septicum]|nr:hypothetical protein [Mycolicibacterium septicum]
MFLQLSTLFTDPNRLFLVSPFQLNRWLDEAWHATGRIPPILNETNKPPFLGDPLAVPNNELPPDFLTVRPSGLNTTDPDKFNNAPGPTGPGGLFIWDHLIYAYLIESTGIFEIFAEVVRRLLIGETLVTLRSESSQWLRATEDLLFKDPPPFSTYSVVSELRPRARANRRNLYWRMFGMDLPHQIPGRWGSSSETAWKSDVGPGVNADFREKWTELLRQVWLSIEHKKNGIGPNPSDPTFLVLLTEALRDMMNNRRRGGNIAREEFVHVSWMGWLHATINSDTPIVQDLQAKATSPADRLAAIGKWVAITPAARSRELFQLAQPMSRILRAIELGFFDTPAKAAQLSTDPILSKDITNIIDNWQSATGERVKERPVGTIPSAQPVRVPVPTRPNDTPIRVSTNGAKV